MSPSYAGLVPEWLENNKTFAKDVFPTLPTPWHMADRRKLVTDKTTLVCGFENPAKTLTNVHLADKNPQ